MDGACRNMQKSLIKQRFTKSLNTYEEYAVVQKDMARKLADIIKNKTYTNVLELGCGTGFLTKELKKSIKFQTYDAVDMVKDCKFWIDKLGTDINFICEDIEEFIPNKEYDLIVSNASLQWVENLPEFINNIHPTKDILFTLFGLENFKEMASFIDSPLKYYSINELKKLFSNYKISDINEDIRVLEFNSAIDVLHHIRNTGVNALSRTSWTKSDLKHFESSYPIDKNKCKLTYHPIYIYLQK